MDMDFATSCPLVRPYLPRIRLLFVGSRSRSTLPSDGPSRFRPCASLVLHLHQVTQGTFTPKLSDMSDTQAGAVAPPPRGFGLDGLTPPRFGLSKQTKADCGRTALPTRTAMSAPTMCLATAATTPAPRTARLWKPRADGTARARDDAGHSRQGHARP